MLWWVDSCAALWHTTDTENTWGHVSRSQSRSGRHFNSSLSHQTLTLQLPATGDSYFDNCMICLDWEHSTSFFKTGPVSVLRHRALEWSDPSQWAEPNPGLGWDDTTALYSYTALGNSSCGAVAPHNNSTTAKPGCPVMLWSCRLQCSSAMNS